MLYFDRIDVSEGIDVNKTSASKEYGFKQNQKQRKKQRNDIVKEIKALQVERIIQNAKIRGMKTFSKITWQSLTCTAKAIKCTGKYTFLITLIVLRIQQKQGGD